MNYILGSGLVAFVAKKMYPNYEIIPVGKSRYYQFDVATCDDYIFCHDNVDDIIKSIVGSSTPIMFKRAISHAGALTFNLESPFIDAWVEKTYNGDAHPYTKVAIKQDGFVYNHSCIDIFKQLEQPSINSCKEFIVGQEKVVKIDFQNQLIITNKRHIEYNKIINTVPLDYLMTLMDVDNELQSLDLHTYIVESDNIDFEGATELLIVDQEIDFHKCTFLGNSRYQFYTTKDISDISSYLQLMLSKFHIVSGTCVKKAIPIGDTTNFDKIPGNIVCVGSNAQWNDGIDMSSCIRRLKKIDSLFKHSESMS